MGSVRRAFVAVLLLAAPAFVRGDEASRLKEALALQETIQKVIEKAEPSIACILVSRSDKYGTPSADVAAGKLGRFEGRPVPPTDEEQRKYVLGLDLSSPVHIPESFGSGVVIDEVGLVLTNAHVVRNATKIFVRLPGGAGSWADIHASDPCSDLAVLRLLDRPAGLKALKLGEGEKVKKGQFVVSLSNPFAAGFRDGSPSASWGIVSNLRRRPPGNPDEMERGRKSSIHAYGTLLQTDTRLALGGSGGALLNLQGELIGLTTSVAALSGSETPGGFAVPMDGGMRRIVEKLRQGEEVEYGLLGVDLSTEDTGGKGVYLKEITHGSPAFRAGFQRGDLIVAIDGIPIRDWDDLFLLIGTRLAGNTVHLDMVRPGQPRRIPISVQLAKSYTPGKIIASTRPPARGGLRVDYTSVLTQREDIPNRMMRVIPEGVLIREVVPDSPADRAHLQKDRIITRVNNQRVTTPAEFYEKMARSSGTVELILQSGRGPEERVTLDLK
jgi:S1-C subfamily serine protease